MPIYPTPTLWFEIGVASLTAIAILWAKAEYALFLYALALGFPDAAYPLGSTINLRVDDVLILLFLARSFLWTSPPLSSGQRNIFKWQGLFLGACLLSIAVETAQGNPPEGYDAAKMAGCAAIFFVLPRLVQSGRRLRFFLSGLMCGGVALVIQVHQHLGETSSNAISNFQQLKSAAAFDTWNPNTIGQAAILLVFGAGLGGILFSKSLASRILWPCLAMGFALVPVALFVRATSLSIVAGFVLFLCLSRQWKWVLLFAAVCLVAVIYLHARDPQLMEDASNINVTTGEGFSHRFERWELTFQGIQENPFLGKGFGQEMTFLALLGSEGRAHNVYLTVWFELGLGGLLLFLFAISWFVRVGVSIYRDPRSQMPGALCLSLIFTLCLEGLGLPTLYWEKLPTIALSLGVAVVGICESSAQELTEEPIRELAFDPVGEHPL